MLCESLRCAHVCVCLHTHDRGKYVRCSPPFTPAIRTSPTSMREDVCVCTYLQKVHSRWIHACAVLDIYTYTIQAMQKGICIQIYLYIHNEYYVYIKMCHSCLPLLSPTKEHEGRRMMPSHLDCCAQRLNSESHVRLWHTHRETKCNQSESITRTRDLIKPCEQAFWN